MIPEGKGYDRGLGGRGAIAALRRHRSAALRAEPAAQSQAEPAATIAGDRLELLCILACLAIWGGTFLAIGRL